MNTPPHPPRDLNWLVTDFIDRVPDAAQAVIDSADGLAVAVSAGFPADRADRLAAVTSGLASLVQGGPRACSRAAPWSRRWWRWTAACSRS